VAQAREVYNFTFHREMFGEPILHGLGKRFRLTITLRRAMLSEEGGWVEVELEGPEEEIGRAIADLQTTGVNTTGPITDLVEPDLDTFVPASIGRGT
jgi:L-aspartate semialdehyde sulfurtransferase ferredoxin